MVGQPWSAVMGGPLPSLQPRYARPASLRAMVDPDALTQAGADAYAAGDLAAADAAWRTAAERGDAAALGNLGILALRSGDREQARRLWEAAGLAGDPQAMCNLGILAHEEGDTASALVWWRRAKTPEAQFHIGRVAYETGDFAAAQDAWEQAAAAGDPSARDHLTLVATGDARRRVLWEKMADRENFGAMWNLGVAAVEQGDLAAVRQWWGQAALLDAGCAAQLAGLIGCEADDAAAAFAAIDNAELAFAIGDLSHGTGRPETARLWWTIAAELGNAAAMFNLGVVAAKAGDDDAAIDWQRRAAAAGDPDAQALLARLGL